MKIAVNLVDLKDFRASLDYGRPFGRYDSAFKSGFFYKEYPETVVNIEVL